ncbi:WD-40 repeat protein [Reticulomyxa filosa]|uniref:WD-40 repeat protein n=1 Tax=Reticulomyxa filosa TaxID=46433 RepID=X6LUL1_RETFI|nr:WD-40 repeat protein [Reticulomyxa filosa]|eukprot:ETO05314.1 WD-40 repeat protein [Reticulomyxa filosa]
MMLSPDGKQILTSSNDKTVRIWDMESGKQIHILEGHKNYVNAAQFSLDGSKIISYSRDTIIKLWETSSGKLLKSFEGHEEDNCIRFIEWRNSIMGCHSNSILQIQFSSNSPTFISCFADKTIRLWDILSGKQLQVFTEHLRAVLYAYFLPDCSKIISHSSDRTIRIWNVSSGKQIQLLEGHTAYLCGTQLSPDGSTLVSCSEDRTIRLWSSNNCKMIDVNETSLVKCIWQGGTQRFGLSMRDSIWKNTNGLTSQQKLLVTQRGGKF